MQLKILLLLILAHLCTDFVLQNKTLVHKKNRYAAQSPHLYLHSFLAGFLSLLLANIWQFWYVGLLISVTHFFIDWWKIASKNDNLFYFLADQILHILVIIMAWLSITGSWHFVITLFKILSEPKYMVVIIAYLTIIFPVGFMIEKATKKWQIEISESKFLEEGLDKAGRYIGILERILVLTLVLFNQISAIGFLIAAKSILRYGDKDIKGARKQTEYVLIGTLMSFSSAIALGLLVRIIWF